MTLLPVLFSTAHALDITSVGGGAREIGLGRAYTAMTGESESLFVNPAGLAKIGTAELTTMYALLSQDVNYNALSLAIPVKFGVIGIGYIGGYTSGLSQTTIEASGRISATGGYNYGSNIGAISFARQVNKRLSLGISGKYYTKGSSQLSGSLGSGGSVDVGLVYEVNPKINIGASVQNIVNTGMGWGSGVTEGINRKAKLGVLLRPNENIRILFDGEGEENKSVVFKGGFEADIKKNLSLRFGMEEIGLNGSENYVNYSAGVGMRLKGIRFDYAYYYDSMLTYNSTHYASVSIPFISPRMRQKQVFSDVAIDSEGFYELDYLYKSGVVKGSAHDGKFRPDQIITRGEYVVMVMDAKGVKEKIAVDERQIFKDVPESYWGAKQIGQAYDMGYIVGNTDGTFRPDESITKLQSDMILHDLGEKERISDLRRISVAKMVYRKLNSK